MQLDKLKQLIGIALSDTTKDFSLQFIMDTVVESILNYCNIEELPEGLVNTAYRMCIERYTKEVSSTGTITAPSGDDTYVSSITEGDTSISFAKNQTTQSSNNSSTSNSDEIINYKSILNRYRKVVFK